MTDLAISSEVLLKAVTRARTLRDKTFVIKLGGSAMEDPVATAGTLDSIAALHTMGLQLILVHGGGKPIDRAMNEAGIEVKKVLGRRYTDDATLEIVVDVLNQLSANIVSELQRRGTEAVQQLPIRAERLMLPGLDLQPVDLGHVGKPIAVDQALLWNVMEYSVIPVVPSLGRDDDDEFLNINADTAASAIAGEFEAEAVFFLTDTPGVLKDRNDTSSLFAKLTVAECRQLIADKVIDGGMIPKVEACFEALEMGAKKAVILDGRNPHSLLSLVLSDTLTGTEIVQ